MGLFWTCNPADSHLTSSCSAGNQNCFLEDWIQDKVDEEVHAGVED
jgi:hypothetical protein